MPKLKVKFSDIRLAIEEISNAKTEFIFMEPSSTGAELFFHFTTIDKVNKTIKVWGAEANVTPEITETKKLYRQG